MSPKRCLMNHLFIENQPYSIFKSDKTAKFYEERCLSMANNGDIVVTSHSIDNDYIKYLDSLGLGISGDLELLTPSVQSKDLASSIIRDDNLLNYICEKTRIGSWLIETFLYGSAFQKILKALNIPLSQPFKIYKKYGSKSGFRKLADKLKLPIPDGIVTHGYEIERINSFSRKFSEIVIKENNTVGGIGVSIIRSDESFIRKIVNDKKKYVIEEKISPEKQGSIQIFIDNGTYDTVIDECIIDETSFKGFRYPFGYYQQRIEGYGKKVVNFLLKEKVNHGYYSLDFIVSNDEIYFHDFNPRKSGVTYVLFFLSKLFDKHDLKRSAIISEHLQLPSSKQWNVKDVIKNLEPLLYNYGKKDEGILLFNCGLLKFNTLHLISLSFCGKGKKYFQKAKRILGIL